MPQIHTSDINGLSISPDSKYLASCGDDKNIIIWDFNQRQMIGLLSGHTDPVQSVKFSKDGNKIVSSSCDKTLRIWDVQTKECLGEIKSDNDLWDAFFFCDDKMIVSSSGDGYICIWNAITFQKITDPLSGLQNPVYGINISPDHKTLVATLFDDPGYMKKWNLIYSMEK